MANKTPVKTDPQQLETAQIIWSNFGVAMKYSTIAVIGFMILLAVIFL